MIGDVLQPTHLIFILVVALLVLGPKRLPEVGRALGRGMRDFRDAMSGADRDQLDEAPSDSASAQTPTAEPTAAPAAPAEPVTAPTPASPPAETAGSDQPAAPPAEEPAAPAEHVR